MKEQQLYTEVKSATTAYVCDKCGRKAAVFGAADENGPLEAQEFVSITFTGGYSSIFGDEETYSVDLCQHCVKDVLGPYLNRVVRESQYYELIGV